VGKVKMELRLLSTLFMTFVLIAAPAGYGDADTGGVKIAGPEEVVFNWTNDRCAMWDIPDAPARAFRDADGKVQLIATHFINRRMVGDTLNSVKQDCNIIMDSHKNPDPSQFNDREWISSVYTLDGKTIYALVHNEYQGINAGRWNAGNDFFNLQLRISRSIQGYNNWYYQEWNGTGYENMKFDPVKMQWKGRRDFCLIGPDWAHPQGDEAARKWVSPINGTIVITGNAHEQNSDTKCGDGVLVKILKNDEELWSKKIANGDTKGHDFNIKVPVQASDAIYFRVHQGDNFDCDTTYFNPTIALSPCQCPSNDGPKCWYNTITFAKSTDKGLTYSHPAAPNHFVAGAPYKYEPDTGPWGVFAPSNIVYNPRDNYYYVMFQLEKRFLQEFGAGLMRTKTLDDPKSWRAWDGNDFNVQFINPYTESEINPAQHICQPVSRDQIEKMQTSLTFNTYFNKFLLVGATGQWENNKLIHGFYYSLSDDLIHWTPRKLIMKAKLPWTPDLQGEVLLYSSLLDPNDTSRNFEKTGQRPYLYYTRMHPYTPKNNGLDRDLVRVPLEFHKSEEAQSVSLGKN
jgi:hypothetical protein